jgi:hypothetical protein
MSYLAWIAGFGAAAVIFLWLRDARIFYRTGLPGYRKAAYQGVLFGALGTLGVACALADLELLGLGLILSALYLQGRITREKVWENESTFERLFGSAARPRANKK